MRCCGGVLPNLLGRQVIVPIQPRDFIYSPYHFLDMVNRKSRKKCKSPRMGPWEAEENGEWLCPGSPYRDIIKSRIPQDPRLRQRCPKAVAQGTLWPPQKTRIVNLKLGADNLFQKTAEWTDVGKFQHHLELKAVSTTPRNDIILVEGLCPDLIDILGTEFDIDPSFFVNHERVGVFSQDPDGTTELPCLPSTINWSANSKGVTFKYYEPLSLSGLPPGFHLSCAHSGRHVGVFRLWGRISRGVVARRKCSIWQVSKACGGYTCRYLSSAVR